MFQKLKWQLKKEKNHSNQILIASAFPDIDYLLEDMFGQEDSET